MKSNFVLIPAVLFAACFTPINAFAESHYVCSATAGSETVSVKKLDERHFAFNDVNIELSTQATYGDYKSFDWTTRVEIGSTSFESTVSVGSRSIDQGSFYPEMRILRVGLPTLSIKCWEKFL